MDGNSVFDRSDIEHVFLNFYSNLWSDSSNNNFVDIFNALPNDLPRLFDLEGLKLTRDVTREEVFATVHKLPYDKSLGPAGLIQCIIFSILLVRN